MWQRLIEGIYMPHGYCLLWEPWLVTLHAGSDVLTFAAYSAIPLAIWIFVRRRPSLEMKGLARLFAAFILWCGLTHLFSAITLWYPIYELQGLVKAATAMISVTTAVLIFPLIPKALAIPSPKELQTANADLYREVEAHRATLVELQKARAELEERVALRTKDLAEATDRFKALFEYAPVAMLMVTHRGEVQQVNCAAEQVFNAKRDQLLGKPLTSLVPDDPAAEPTGSPQDAGAEEKNSTPEVLAFRSGGNRFPAEVRHNPVPAEGTMATIVSVIDISERRKQSERLQFIMRELSHRSKNLLAVIQGMVRQAIASSPDMGAFERSFTERLQGLARSHDLLVGKNWQGAAIEELVETQLAFLKRSDSKTISIDGPSILLSPEAAQNLGLALHELATNAAKHGALRDPDGTIEVSWRIGEERAGQQHVDIHWKEAGRTSSSARQPAKKGFGRTVLERVVPASLGGKAALTFGEGTAHWHLQVPLDMLTSKGTQVAA